jgi:hypothetical protein
LRRRRWPIGSSPQCCRRARQRPVAGYDVSAWGQGAQAIAKGVQTLGADVQKGAQDVAEVETYPARNSALLAQDKILGDAINLREKYKHDQDFGTLQERYNTDLDGLVDQGIQNVPQGPLRDHVMARLQIPLSRERASIEEQTFNGRRQNAHADIFNRQKNLIERTGPFDDPVHTARIDSFKDIADEYGRQGLLTPLEVAQHKQQLGVDLGDARARARIDLGPAEAAKVERELRASVPRGGASTDRGRAVEVVKLRRPPLDGRQDVRRHPHRHQRIASRGRSYGNCGCSCGRFPYRVVFGVALPPEGGIPTTTPQHSLCRSGFLHFPTATRGGNVAVGNRHKPLCRNQCCGVAVGIPPSGGR